MRCYSDYFGSWQDVVVQGIVKITLSTYNAQVNPLTSQLQFLVLLSLTDECNSMKPVEFFHKNS